MGTQGTFAYGIFGGNIVGYFNDSAGDSHGFLYNGSGYTTLDDPFGADGTVAYGISGNNIVGGYTDASGNSHGFVASVPEPSAFVLAALGVLGVIAWRLRGLSKSLLVTGPRSPFQPPGVAHHYNPNDF